MHAALPLRTDLGFARRAGVSGGFGVSSAICGRVEGTGADASGSAPQLVDLFEFFGVGIVIVVVVGSFQLFPT